MEKLVRDRIPEIIKKQGKEPVTYIAQEDEYYRFLVKKLDEEMKEFLESNETEELVDLMEVIYAIAIQKGISKEELENIRSNKANERGEFKNRLILKEIKENKNSQNI